MPKFKPGDRAWIIESNYTVVEVIIKQVLVTTTLINCVIVVV